MNAIFFLLPLLIFTSVPFVFAETGYDYFDIDNSDGTRTFTTHHPYVFDGNNWTPYIASGTQIETHLGTVTLNGTGYFQWNGKFDDSIKAKYADISDLNTWTYPSTLNNDTPEISWDGSQLVLEREKVGVGNLKYKYIFDNGKWKTQLEATNLSSLTTKAFGFDQIIDLKSDTIRFGGVTRNLDNFHGQTFTKEFLDANQGKLLDLMMGVYFDFDLGYENLYSITVYDTGINKSRLVFDYRTSEVILRGETLIIDPTFSYTVGSTYEARTALGTGTTCPAWSDITNDGYVQLGASGSSAYCRLPSYQWNTTSIPDTAIITNINLRWDSSVSSFIQNCNINPITTQPSTHANTPTGSSNLATDIQDGTPYVAGATECTSTTSNVVDVLGAAANSDLQSLLGANWFAVGFEPATSMTRDTTNRFVDLITGDVELEVTYSLPSTPTPDAITDLTSLSQSYGTVDLSWTEPGLNGETCQGYQINYTTPYGNPNTIITNNTSTCTTSTSVTGLGTGTPYTFGVSVWTAGGNNATHPPMTWYNITTGGNFTIGTATFNQTNSFVLPITFEEQTINGTAEFLNVTFSNTFNLACDFHYKFANTNQTYTNLTSYAVSSTLDETSFVFTNGTNEIIDVYCWDQITDTNARYLLKQTDFPILDQILGFRSGDYGTQGMFGVFDLVTLLVIIGSMIGLNRENESVGIVFNVMLMFSLSFFGIIELTTVIFGMIALVLVFVITSTKKS